IAKILYMEKHAGEEQLQKNGRHGQNIICNDAGSQHVAGRNGGDMEAPQNSLFPEGDEGGAQTPEAAHDREGYDGPEKVAHALGNALGENSGVKKKETEGHDHAEKQKHFVANGQLNSHAGESGKITQSRNLLPVSSMNTSSSEGVAISRETSSFPVDSRCFTRETMACGGRWHCRMLLSPRERRSETPSRSFSLSCV